MYTHGSIFDHLLLNHQVGVGLINFEIAPSYKATIGKSGLIIMMGVVNTETLYKGDDALSTKPVMHYQGTSYLCY